MCHCTTASAAATEAEPVNELHAPARLAIAAHVYVANLSRVMQHYVTTPGVRLEE